MNIEKMRSEFEARFPVPFGVEWREGHYHISSPNAKRKQITLAGHLFYLGRWESWQASRAAIEIELQPEWHPMSEDPPFPFTGDIFVAGKIWIGVAWCAGYWTTTRGGCLDRESVSHWKRSNPHVQPPALEVAP